MPLSPPFNLYGRAMHGTVIAWRGKPLERESAIYTRIATYAKKYRYICLRLENKLQNGTPDILLYQGADYWLIECKVCRKKVFRDLEKDLSWQPGQLALLLRSLDSRYLLAVYHDSQIYYLTGSCHALDSLPPFAQSL